MRSLLWLPVLIAILFWSLFSWIAYKLLDGIAELIASGFGAILGGWAAWLINGLGDIGQGIIVIVWFIGAWWMLAPMRG